MRRRLQLANRVPGVRMTRGLYQRQQLRCYSPGSFYNTVECGPGPGPSPIELVLSLSATGA